MSNTTYHVNGEQVDADVVVERLLKQIKQLERKLASLTAKRSTLKAQLTTVTAERDAAIRDKAHLSTAILQELPQELYLKVFDRYHKERGTYSHAQPTYQPEPKDRNLAEAWAERDGDI